MMFKKMIRVDSPHGLRFAMWWEFTEELWKIGETSRFFARFSQRLDRFLLYRKSETEGESTHNVASFSYISLCGEINYQILLIAPDVFMGLCRDECLPGLTSLRV